MAGSQGQAGRGGRGRGSYANPNQIQNPNPNLGRGSYSNPNQIQNPNLGRGSYSNPNQIQNPNLGCGSYSNPNPIQNPTPGRGSYANPNPGRGSYANPNPIQNPNAGRGSYANPNPIQNSNPGRGSYTNPNPIQNPNLGHGSYANPRGPAPQQSGPINPNPRGPGPQQSGPVYSNPHGPGAQQSGPVYSNPRGPGPQQSGPVYSNPRGPGPQQSGPVYSNPRGPGPQQSGPVYSNPRGPGPQQSGPVYSNPRGPGPQQSGPVYSNPRGPGPQQSGPVYSNPRGPGPQQSGPVYSNPRGPGPQQSGPVYSNPRGPGPQQPGSGPQNQHPNPSGPGSQQTRVMNPHANPYSRPGQQNPVRPQAPAQQASGPRPTDLPQASRQAEATQKATQGVVAENLDKKMGELAIQPSSSMAVRVPTRPGIGMKGCKVVVKANHFLVQLPDQGLYQYDVVIKPEMKTRGANRAVVKALIKAYESKLGGKLPVYDGMKSLYTAGRLPFDCHSFEVFLTDSNQQRERKFDVEIRRVHNADPRHIEMFMSGRQPDAPLDAIQMLDTVLRETNSNTEKIVLVGRSFFSKNFGLAELGNGVEGWKGFYQSLRPTQMGLSLNFDLSSTAFVKAGPVLKFVTDLLGKNIAAVTLQDSDKIKRALKNVKVLVTHRSDMPRKYRISNVSRKATKDITFDQDGRQTSIVNYFREKYNYRIQHIHLPCLQMSGNTITYFPMEVCQIVEGQRYNRKLNENQVTQMLLSTCQKPPAREYNIINSLKENKYNSDSFVIEFEMQVDERLTQIDARILPAPNMKYHATGREQECLPKFGQWNMRDKKLVDGKSVNSWYCISFSNMQVPDADYFCKCLVDMCRTSGMGFAPNPVIATVKARPDQLEHCLKDQYQNAIRALKGQKPDLLIAIVNNSNGTLYSDLKRICETELGLVTQCCLLKNAQKCNAQCLANLALKINVKVGGRNTVVKDPRRMMPIIGQKPTIIFGADVTHPNPGDDSSPSIAAVVASRDWPDVAVYCGDYRAQAHRQEIISDLGEMVKDHLMAFRRATGFEPHQIIFYRDGVSEGQFHQVLAYEINAIRRICSSLSPSYKPSITFIVVQKRHHTRLFPTDHNKDRSENVLPGTVVDTKICHPTEFDFYLNSHAGIQGTNRPTHYHVLCDENNFLADDLQVLTYNLCYTYARCTRSVSVVPPAYYAHQIAFRARSYLGTDLGDSSSDGASGSTHIRHLPEIKANLKNVMFYC
ncbi:hypothetical protein LUZ60_002460 [Juncus effusus]|nr:hypothetical protein LUZ60_002460 [Juncus effusus]